MYTTPKNIKQIDVMGVTISIIISDALCNKQEAFGYYLNKQIVLKSTYPTKSDYIDVLSHESFHALCDTLGLIVSDDIEEILANTMGQVMAKLVNSLVKGKVFTDVK